MAGHDKNLLPFDSRAHVVRASGDHGANNSNGSGGAAAPNDDFRSSSRGVGGRLTVPFPRTLPDLKAAAMMHFGAPGRVQLHHQGRQLRHHTHLQDVRHNDVVQAEFVKRDSTPHQDQWVSTHREYFVERALPGTEIPVQNAHRSVLLEATKGEKFDDTGSMYKTDFRRPQSARDRQPKKGTDMFRTHITMGSDSTPGGTTYRSHYPWKFKDVDRPPNPNTHSVLTAAVVGLPLGEVSNHTYSYTPRAYDADQPPKASGDDSDSILSLLSRGQPFNGKSTYAASYIRPVDDGRPPSCKPRSSLSAPSGFDATSEYRDRFPDVAAHRNKVILERIA